MILLELSTDSLEGYITQNTEIKDSFDPFIEVFNSQDVFECAAMYDAIDSLNWLVETYKASDKFSNSINEAVATAIRFNSVRSAIFLAKLDTVKYSETAVNEIFSFACLLNEPDESKDLRTYLMETRRFTPTMFNSEKLNFLMKNVAEYGRFQTYIDIVETTDLQFDISVGLTGDWKHVQPYVQTICEIQQDIGEDLFLKLRRARALPEVRQLREILPKEVLQILIVNYSQEDLKQKLSQINIQITNQTQNISSQLAL